MEKKYLKTINTLGIPDTFFDDKKGTVYAKLKAANKALSGFKENFNALEKENLSPIRKSNLRFFLENIENVGNDEDKDMICYILNMCMHIASSALLLHSEPKNLKAALNDLKNELGEDDASSPLASVVLFCLIEKANKRTSKKKANKRTSKKKEQNVPNEDIAVLRDCLIRLKWFIGDKGVKTLGMDLKQD